MGAKGDSAGSFVLFYVEISRLLIYRLDGGWGWVEVGVSVHWQAELKGSYEQQKVLRSVVFRVPAT